MQGTDTLAQTGTRDFSGKSKSHDHTCQLWKWGEGAAGLPRIGLHTEALEGAIMLAKKWVTGSSSVQ